MCIFTSVTATTKYLFGAQEGVGTRNEAAREMRTAEKQK